MAGPIIHKRLLDLRISARHPWLVTHTVVSEREAPEVWGLDFSNLETDVISQVGMEVRVTLPATGSLGRAELTGDKARLVPTYRAGQPVPDPDGRAARMVQDFLRHPGEGGGLIGAMERDIAGSSLRIQVGDFALGGATSGR